MTVSAIPRVSNRRLRVEFLDRSEKGWISARDVALRMDWLDPKGRPDGNRVLRQLGVNQTYMHGRWYRLSSVMRDRAVLLAEAIGLDPVDVGL